MRTLLTVFAIALALSVTTGCQGDIKGAPRIVKVATGMYHTVLLKDDGTVWAAGRNNCGQLGLEGTYQRGRFTQVPGLTGMVDVCAGELHTVAVKDDGTVWVTGENRFAQLGLGNNRENRFGFIKVPGFVDAVAAAAGSGHTVVLKRDGTVWGTGWNGSGQLGLKDKDHGGINSVTEFTPLPGITGGRQLLAGSEYTMVLRTDGTLWGTGSNYHGELGMGTGTSVEELFSHEFRQINGVAWVRDISGRHRHTLLVKDDGTVWVTGENTHGQLGLGAGSPEKVTEFTQVPGITGASRAVAGWGFSFVIMKDGRAYSTGWNDEGQLGLGDKSDRYAFMKVPGVTGAVAGAAGAAHTMLLDVHGEVLGTGSNLYGQLGKDFMSGFGM